MISGGLSADCRPNKSDSGHPHRRPPTYFQAISISIGPMGVSIVRDRTHLNPQRRSDSATAPWSREKTIPVVSWSARCPSVVSGLVCSWVMPSWKIVVIRGCFRQKGHGFFLPLASTTLISFRMRLDSSTLKPSRHVFGTHDPVFFGRIPNFGT
jgi:hypothetical protein